MGTTASAPIDVLIVDDDENYGKLIRTYLSTKRRKTYVLRIAVTLGEALALASERTPEVVVLDLGLPDSNGLATLKRMLACVPATPILVLTGLTNEKTGEQAVARGAQDYLVKDEVTGVLLERAILYTLERYKRNRALQERDRRLAESERRFRKMIEKSRDGMLVVDRSGIVQYLNPAAEDLFGRPAADFIGEHVGFPIEPETSSEITILRKGEDKVIAELRSASIYMTFSQWRNQKACLVNFRDITARKTAEEELRHSWNLLDKKVHERTRELREVNRRLQQEIDHHRRTERKREILEKQLIQASRMEAVGTLAGGIAHDFNNILASVIGYTELALCDAEPDSPLAGHLHEIFHAGGRAKELVRQILTFCRHNDQELKPVQVELIVREALKFLRPTLPTTIEIQSAIESHSLVMAPPAQIHQVVMNLCTNAAYAMEKNGGVLTVRLSDRTLPAAPPASASELPPGDYIELEIEDTGTGIDRQHLDSIFEPYFTTKPEGEGTGLGLSVVHGIAKMLGGDVRIQSEVGSGTTATVLLPVIMKRGAKPAGEEEVLLPRGTERILFVDDEAPITKLSCQQLERCGYHVVVCTRGDAALALFRQQADRFDLVITDMTMPQMTGDQLAAELLAIRPGIPVILCTGYSRKITAEKAARIGIKELLMKPLKQDQLLCSVRRVLDDQKTGGGGMPGNGKHSDETGQ
jgi:PAS domain S-box-containing protein